MRSLLLAVLAALAAGDAPAPVRYQIESITSKVLVVHEQVERRAARGEAAAAGDTIRTGWFGRAVVAVPAAAARFEIYSRTEAVLAGPEPGVLITVHKGVLKASFDTLLGTGDRLVSTPGALLAVRGTRYGVDVAADGTATLAVFEGTVEVRSRIAGTPPLLVPAGAQCAFSPHLAPRREAMPREWTEQGWRGASSAQSRPDGAGGGSPPQQSPRGPGARGGGGRG
ncbi:MAG: FecR family protein [Thermoanaerobaculaceae bacterium]|jgi:hypothetical protein|nr:FecR family protein [Thermoanaerobaculaceae bacterium]